MAFYLSETTSVPPKRISEYFFDRLCTFLGKFLPNDFIFFFFFFVATVNGIFSSLLFQLFSQSTRRPVSVVCSFARV